MLLVTLNMAVLSIPIKILKIKAGLYILKIIKLSSAHKIFTKVTEYQIDWKNKSLGKI